MGTLSTVQNYVDAARVLLQDAVVPYRYPTADLLGALNVAMAETRRLRPDFWIGVDDDDIPSFSASDSTVVDINIQYRSAILYFIVGFVQLRDEEDTQDPRALGLMGKFSQQLLALG